MAPGYDAFLQICNLVYLNVAAFGFCDAPNRLPPFCVEFLIRGLCLWGTMYGLEPLLTSDALVETADLLGGCAWPGDRSCGYGSLPGHWVGSLGVLDADQLAAAPPQWQTFDPRCQLAPLLGSILAAGAGAPPPPPPPPPGST